MDIEDCAKCVKPCVPMYGPINIKDLKVGDTKFWCTCGRSQKQPFCDGSHKGTPFKPLKWTVDKEQRNFMICNCKYTKDPPFCDGSHIHLPLIIKKQQQECLNVHSPGQVCIHCGWKA